MRVRPPGDRGDGRQQWRTAQQGCATEPGIELLPTAWAREWRRRRLAMLTVVDEALLTYRAEDRPDATDERVPWAAGVEASRMVIRARLGVSH